MHSPPPAAPTRKVFGKKLWKNSKDQHLADLKFKKYKNQQVTTTNKQISKSNTAHIHPNRLVLGAMRPCAQQLPQSPKKHHAKVTNRGLKSIRSKKARNKSSVVSCPHVSTSKRYPDASCMVYLPTFHLNL